MSPAGAGAGPFRREEALTRLAAEPLDLLVIGGGITGAGAAREAARRGLRVGLVEREDLASGTSSRSSKLVHGGLRYLEQLELGLVFESVSERRVLQRIAPHLVRPLPFLFPIYQGARHGPLVMDIGMWLYDALSLFRSPKLHRSLRPDRVAVEEPCLRRDALRGASLYYDCATDDARLTLETVRDAVASGALVATYAEVESLTRESGRIVGARVRDRLGERTLDVRAKAILNATGPFTDLVRRGERPLVRRTKGIHIVVDLARLPVRHANVILHPRDGRVMFVIPWGDRTYVGTTDTDFEGDPSDVHATRDDVRYTLDAVAHYFPDARLGEADVISTWAGLRPLLRGDGSPSSVSREHGIYTDADGLVSIAGGKLTTYRRMAIDAVEAILPILKAKGALPPLRAAKTEATPLPGGEGYPQGADAEAAYVASVVAASGGALTDAQARHLFAVYGTRALGLAERVARSPALAAPFAEGRADPLVEVDVAVEEELAQTAADVLARRTTVLLKASDQGLRAIPAVVARMGDLLGWDAARRAREEARARAEIDASRRFREAEAVATA